MQLIYLLYAVFIQLLSFLLLGYIDPNDSDSLSGIAFLAGFIVNSVALLEISLCLKGSLARIPFFVLHVLMVIIGSALIMTINAETLRKGLGLAQESEVAYSILWFLGTFSALLFSISVTQNINERREIAILSGLQSQA